MSWELELGYMKINLKIDSMVTGNWILLKSTPHWNICNKLDRLRGLIAQIQVFKCTHVFREAN